MGDGARIGAACALAAGLAACFPGHDAAEGPSEAYRYVNDAAYRRSELEAAIVNPSNDYSSLRLRHYATGDSRDWDHLMEWNPPVDVVEAAELDRAGGADPRAPKALAALDLPEVTGGAMDDAALLALGRVAFWRYPVQRAPRMRAALASREAAARYGLWIDDARGVGGVVRAQMADGSTELALTCASCHAAPGESGALEDGRPNARFDYGAVLLDPSNGAGAPPGASSWGPGRVDVTTTLGDEPVRIPDLRPVRFLTHLHQEATLRARDATTLATRIETLVTTSNAQLLRPPRAVAYGLALYVLSLADALPREEDAARASPDGARLFAERCAGCHAPPALTGAPVDAAIIGTDPALALSSSRGTGAYRVPSLHGAGTRGPLLHDGRARSIADLFDPARLQDGYTAGLHGAGAIRGHTAGLDLPDAERAALVDYVSRL